jgi:hypothetical protein
MTFQRKTLSKALAAIFLPVLVLVSPLALAAGDATAASLGKTDSARCAGDGSNCRVRASDSEVARAFISHARLDVCPEDSPECGARAKAKRIHADHESRDRHACRD